MQIRLVPRQSPSQFMVYAAPIAAVLFTIVFGGLVFSLIDYDGVATVCGKKIGYNGFATVCEIFRAPIFGPSDKLDFSAWPDLWGKAAPLIIIAIGLSICFRANVWNIGAEGQYLVGALAGTGVALLTWEMEGWWILPLMCLAGALGGALYAAIPAFLRTRLQVNEILSSLMLTYVSLQLLYYLMNGPWKDPMGFGFPTTRMFNPSQILPEILPYIHFGIPLAFFIALLAWLAMSRSVFGFQIRVAGAAPTAARYGGFNEKLTIWFALLISGALAGLAGVFEAAGPFGQMTSTFPAGYGFTAIIIAFLGRLHPVGIIFAGLVLAVSYVGGEIVQYKLGVPNAAVGVLQAMMLFSLLAMDVLIKSRIEITLPGGRVLGKQEGGE